jgi:polysaccharide export outer membrane protein
MTVIRPSQGSADANPALQADSSKGDNPKGSASAVEVDLISLLSKGDLSQNIMIHPGDALYISSGTGLRYYVLGQVGSPGPYEWSQDITVLEAIKQAGGVRERGAPNRIKVRKIYNGQKQEIKINLVDIMKGRKKDDVVVKAGDTIIVPESWI